MAGKSSPARADAAPSGPLTRERILEAAEDTLRRFGPGKTTVVDVARALGVSHGTVYRHFASKTELRDSVLEQWLERRVAPLLPIVEETDGPDPTGAKTGAEAGPETGAVSGAKAGMVPGGGHAGSDSPAADRLRRWLVALMESKREEARSDPDLFAAYAELSAQAREVILRHVAELTRQLTQLIVVGAANGEFAVADPAASARAVFAATSRFHHPAHAIEWVLPAIDEAFDEVWALIMTGLSPR
jgi:AcrR family transcriptional regulator